MSIDKLSKPLVRFVASSVVFLSVFTGIFIKLADELREQDLYRFDYPIIQLVQSYIDPQLTGVMKFFTFIGSGKVIVVLLIISMFLMVRRKKNWEAVFLLTAASGGALFNLLLKWHFHRIRPSIHPLIKETGYSFPSGHSMEAIIFYGMLGYFLCLFFESKFLQRLSVMGATGIILLVGLSRIYLGVHYPSDVLAAYAAGGVWLIICLTGLKIIVEVRQRNIRPGGGYRKNNN
ncbi:phosphatase PAP2 family protein [Desulfotomaculum nigrificans]|uniref:phosphatase PAP2 family protein n=1 Tax=Desulfotomaculum nigrificans TaxID=1565 RepID=UPI0001FAF237|nr:phosphatase PAP2 family protein [Desulfotomaculum nigrificans]